MSRNPSKLVFAMAALLAVWVAVFWLYKPRLNEANGAPSSGGISYGTPPDVARALVATDPVLTKPQPSPVAPLPVAPLPGQQAAPPTPIPAPTPTPGKHLVAPEFTDYTVQKGDSSFAAISKRFFGTTKHGEAISRANPFVTPDKLIAGKTKLRIPKDPTNIQGRIEETPGTTDTQPQAPATAAADSPQTHTVQPGETLGAISKRYYGTTSRWKAILEANADVLDKPERLRAGMTLKIPPKD